MERRVTSGCGKAKKRNEKRRSEIRTCVSRRSEPAAGAAVPAVAGPGTADQPAHTIAALANASQNSTATRRRSVHQHGLPYWLPRRECVPPASVGSPGSAWGSRVAISPTMPRSPAPAGRSGSRSRASYLPCSSPPLLASALSGRWRAHPPRATATVTISITAPGGPSAKCQHPRAFSRSRATATTIQLPPAFATLIGGEAKHPPSHQYMP
jgi:hypothetical protein